MPLPQEEVVPVWEEIPSEPLSAWGGTWSPAPKRRMGTVWPALLVGCALWFASFALWLVVDLDRDGASAWSELRDGTNPAVGDSDGDGLADGWETRSGLNAQRLDSDFDTIPDNLEIEQRSNPAVHDSDGDGLYDGGESGTQDCDRDGFAAILESDDDADGRQDSLEGIGDRCSSDGDGDGVLDGFEGRSSCVRNKDCDADGLDDGAEVKSIFDPLRPDTFGSGVQDGVSEAFRKAGQTPTKDADQDGIADGWENTDGLIVWGSLRPLAGQKDLLIEYLRVEGSDSARFSFLDFTAAYQAVATAFLLEQDIHVSWVETRIRTGPDVDPPLIPSSTEPYYANLLARGTYSSNPYVTTVVLNPQHDQSETSHSGVAPLRGLLAAVDYGQFVVVDFEAPSGARVTLSPFFEEIVRGNRLDLIQEQGFDDGFVASDGKIVLASTQDDAALTWQPSWFRTAPLVVFGSGESVQLKQVGARVGTDFLASTILHELGHTLGLCHTHIPECTLGYSAADRANQASSTMSYDAPGSTLHFLASEWKQVLAYLACPPQAPLIALANGAAASTIRTLKYDNSDRSSLESRKCNVFTPLAREFQPNSPAQTLYRLDGVFETPLQATKSFAVTLVAFLLVSAASIGLAIGVHRKARNRQQSDP